MHEKKVKGDIAVSYAIARLTELGWNVGILITEHAKYDLLIEKDTEVLRVQVKFTTAKAGSIPVSLRNCWVDRNSIHITKRITGSYDVLAVYCPDTKQVYFIRDSQIGNNTSEFRLRITSNPSRNQSNSRNALDFLNL
jgi:hypothetical protein